VSPVKVISSPSDVGMVIELLLVVKYLSPLKNLIHLALFLLTPLIPSTVEPVQFEMKSLPCCVLEFIVVV
jgi:hypothetical protein